MAVGIRRIAVLPGAEARRPPLHRAGLPGAAGGLPVRQIRLIGLPWSSEFVHRFDGYLDGLFVLPGFPGFPERPFDARAFTRFLDDVQAWAPDLVVQMHGSGELANPLVMLLGGVRRSATFGPAATALTPNGSSRTQTISPR